MLPDDNTAWPPPGMSAFYQQVQTWSAWYGDRVAQLYPATVTSGGRSVMDWSLNDLKDAALGRGVSAITAPAPSALGSMHVPVAADVARVSSDLLFAELPKLTSASAQGRLEELIGESGLEAALPEAGELCAALSGIYWRVGYDTASLPDRPWFDFVQPGLAVPEWGRGYLQAVTFWDVLPKPPRGQDGTYRHLERHSMARALNGVTLPEPLAMVEHGLYLGDDGSLGRRVPLTEHPMTQGLAAGLVDEDYLLLPRGVPMTAGFVKNIGPNRQLPGSYFGRSDIAGLDGALSGIDKAWTSWMRDLDLGKGRAIVPEEFLRTDGRPGGGAAFDLDRAVYSSLRMPPSATGSPITLMQFNIRVEEHERTILRLLSQVIGSAGYSLGSFGLSDGQGVAVTATEIKAKYQQSMTTREKKTRLWSPELRKMLNCLLAVDALVLGNDGSTAAGDVEVEFGETVAEDPKVTAETVALLFQAEAASTAERVRLVHPDWDDTQVNAEVRLIETARQLATPSPLLDDESADEGTPPEGNGAPGDAAE